MASRLTRMAQAVVASPAFAPLALRFGPQLPKILMYHGVSVGEPPSWRAAQYKHLALDVFVAQLRLLRRTRRVIPLAELVEGLRHGADLRGAVAITFDDGYRNNVTRAAPALADLKLPATFFLATGFIGTGRWAWTDRIERAFELVRVSEATLALLGRRVPLQTAEQRLAALQQVKLAIKRLDDPQVEGNVAGLEAAFGVEPGAPEGDERFMSWDEARGLAAAGFELGAHTINHPILSRIPLERAQSEILGSRDRIIAETGACSPVFCYPNGGKDDYGADVVNICREHFSAALSTNRGAARHDELYELRRYGAPGSVEGLSWQLLRPE